MGRRELIVGVATGLLLSTIGALASSDWPGWASIHRVNDLRSLVLFGNIQGAMKDYCDTAGNRAAAVAVQRDIEMLERQYAAISGGQMVPLRPCP